MLGIIHCDRDGAPAFVFDIMEPESFARPRIYRHFPIGRKISEGTAGGGGLVSQSFEDARLARG